MAELYKVLAEIEDYMRDEQVYNKLARQIEHRGRQVLMITNPGGPSEFERYFLNKTERSSYGE